MPSPQGLPSIPRDQAPGSFSQSHSLALVGLRVGVQGDGKFTELWRHLFESGFFSLFPEARACIRECVC